MNSRTGLLLGVVGLAAVAGALVWSTRIKSTDASVATNSGSEQAAPAPGAAVVLDPSGRDAAAASQGRSAGTSPAQDARLSDGGADTQRRTLESNARASSGVIAPPELQPTVQVTPEVDPPELPPLDPIVGGTDAIKTRYIGSTYEERRTRADLLESALTSGGKIEADAYQALKDELIWLRENMGTPPEKK